MSLATVFIHQGPADHLIYAIVKARQSDPAGRIIVVTDGQLPPNVNFVELVPLASFAREVSPLEESYWHFSINPLQFEFFCITRWFILRRLMVSLDLGCIVHYDSDVLTFCPASDFAKAYSGCAVALSQQQSMHTAVLHGTEFLDLLCGEIGRFYNNESSPVADRLWSSIRKYKAPSPEYNISDMSFIREAGKELTASKIVDLSAPHDGALCDHNMNVAGPHGFAMSDGVKEITWKERQPYGRIAATGELVRFRSLHFQGNAKAKMAPFFERSLETDG